MAFATFLIVLFGTLGCGLALGLLAGRDRRVRAVRERLDRLEHPERGRFGVWIAKDRRFPLIVRLLPITAFVYWVTPLDMIPDFIPKVGFLDDRALLGLALWLTLRLGPADRFEEHLQHAEWFAARHAAEADGETGDRPIEDTWQPQPTAPAPRLPQAASDVRPAAPRRDPFDDPEVRREPRTPMPWL